MQHAAHEIPHGGGSAVCRRRQAIFKPFFSPPPRCRPRQAWSRAGHGVMRLRQSLPARPPAAPRQPQGEHSGSLAGTRPRVTPGQAALTPSLRVPASHKDAGIPRAWRGAQLGTAPASLGVCIPPPALGRCPHRIALGDPTGQSTYVNGDLLCGVSVTQPCHQ